MPETIPSSPDGTGLKVAVLTAQWYGEITARLQAAALTTLTQSGVAEDDILIMEIPGVYELPQAAAWIARSDDMDAIVALGCVVRGETPHFDYICASASEGLMQVALESGIPVGLGVITAETVEQAEARSSETRSNEAGSNEAGGKGGNKGVESADAAIRMAASYRALEARRVRQ
jgi:6,7-dimethyl-8-ribityllumazine synthase